MGKNYQVRRPCIVYADEQDHFSLQKQELQGVATRNIARIGQPYLIRCRTGAHSERIRSANGPSPY